MAVSIATEPPRSGSGSAVSCEGNDITRAALNAGPLFWSSKASQGQRLRRVFLAMLQLSEVLKLLMVLKSPNLRHSLLHTCTSRRSSSSWWSWRAPTSDTASCRAHTCTSRRSSNFWWSWRAPTSDTASCRTHTCTSRRSWNFWWSWRAPTSATASCPACTCKSTWWEHWSGGTCTPRRSSSSRWSP